MARTLVWIAVGTLMGAAGYAVADHATKQSQSDGLKPKVLIEQVLPEKLDGKAAKVTVLELERAPGSAGAPHRHPGPVFVYVLDGELETKVGDRPVRTYKKGEMFYEPPRALHAVSRNPSRTRPVRFLAFLLTDKDTTQLVLPEKH